MLTFLFFLSLLPLNTPLKPKETTQERPSPGRPSPAAPRAGTPEEALGAAVAHGLHGAEGVADGGEAKPRVDNQSEGKKQWINKGC